jgi:hypothetical protein
MTTGLTYTTYVAQIATLAVVPVTDTNYISIIPSMIDYAELRMQRDLDFLNTVATSSYTPASVTPSLALSTNTSSYPYVTVQNIAVVDPTSGFTKQLTPVSKEWIYNTYPIGSTTALPVYYAPFDDNEYLLGPQPDQIYTYSVVGTQRFPTLSATNTTTFISQYLPDVFIMASMIYISAYQRNFTSIASNDPQMAVTYESQYQALLKGAMVEEARKKFEASAWSSMSPPMAATAQR